MFDINMNLLTGSEAGETGRKILHNSKQANVRSHQGDPICNSVFHLQNVVTKDQPDGSVPALTALPRPEWARIRKEYFSESLNQQSLEAIEEAMFVVW